MKRLEKQVIRHLDNTSSAEERKDILQWFKKTPDAILTRWNPYHWFWWTYRRLSSQSNKIVEARTKKTNKDTDNFLCHCIWS
jgi:hypothetical protein